MKHERIYDSWAPVAGPWSAWVKPVLFTQLHHAGFSPRVPGWPGTSWANAIDLARQRLALVVDLPGPEAIRLGVALATAGFRPVPLFNTSYGPRAIVPVRESIQGLLDGAGNVAHASLPTEAPPAFLLDSLRMPTRTAALPGQYDNRWLVFPQDFPSARFLQEQRIAGVVLVQEEIRAPQSDLAHVLLRWQEAGIPVLAAKSTDPMLAPIAWRVSKPPRYRSLWHHALALIGLRRNSAGGFGALVPEPSQTGSGRGFG